MSGRRLDARRDRGRVRPTIVVCLWDPVELGPGGELESRATFAVILEGLRRSANLVVVCNGPGRPQSADGITVLPVGAELTAARLLSRPLAAARLIRRAVRAALAAVHGEPATAVLLVDPVLHNVLAAAALDETCRGYLYLRGDDVAEAWSRTRGIRRPLGAVHAGLVWLARAHLCSKLRLIGAGGAPLGRGTPRRESVYAFYPSSIVDSGPEASATLPDGDWRSADEIRVVSVGRLIPLKRLDILIAGAHAFVRRSARRATVDIFGDGPERARLERLAERCVGPRLTVIFRGQTGREDVLAGLREADLLAITSRREGFPKVVPEALAQACPVISTPVGSLPEFLHRHHVGTVIEPTAEGLARGLALYLERPGLLAAQRRRALTVAKEVTLDAQCRRLVAHLCGTGAASPPGVAAVATQGR